MSLKLLRSLTLRQLEAPLVQFIQLAILADVLRLCASQPAGKVYLATIGEHFADKLPEWGVMAAAVQLVVNGTQALLTLT